MCSKCKVRPGDYSQGLCRFCWGKKCDGEDHEASQRWIRDERIRNPRWMPPLGGDEP